MNKVTKYILKSISYIIISIVFIFVFLIVGVRLFGIEVYTVLSGSMEPNYKVGSLIYVVDVDTDSLKENDVITFFITDNVVATHRIVSIIDSGNDKKYQTKGDANKEVDENLVSSNKIVGKPVFTIPYLGYVTTFMQTISGKLVTTGVSLLLILVVIIIDFLTDDKKNKNK